MSYLWAQIRTIDADIKIAAIARFGTWQYQDAINRLTRCLGPTPFVIRNFRFSRQLNNYAGLQRLLDEPNNAIKQSPLTHNA